MALAKPDGVLGEVSTVAVTSVTPACPDASGSHMAHRQGLTSFSDNDRGIPLPTATSLPVLGAHGSDDYFDSMIKGLSSPSFHMSLASPQSLAPNASRATAAAVSSVAATAAAAATAFALSMTGWAPTSVLAGQPLHRIAVHSHNAENSRAVAMSFPNGKDEECPARASASASGGIGTASRQIAEVVESQLCQAWCPPQGAAPGEYGASGSSPSPVLPLRPLLTYKRGLYEGTVRGGSARNTWLYVSTGTPPG